MRNINIIWIIIALGILGCQANPEHLKSERNLLRGMELSKQTKKPIFIHFTGHGCIGYNEFQYDLITSREIQNRLNDEFVTIELYVDDKREIQINDTLNIGKLGLSDTGMKKIKRAKNIGSINAAIEIDWLNNNSQPLYVITDSERNILVEPFGYQNRDRKHFLVKLDEGLKEFKKKKIN